MKKRIFYSNIIFSALAAATFCAPLNVLASPLPNTPPSPQGRPLASTQPKNVSLSTTTSNAASLKAGLDALYSNNGRLAISLRNKMPKNSLDRHILTWAIGISGNTDIPSSEIYTSLDELKGWPGLKIMQMNSERALARENLSPDRIINAYGTTTPLTAEGMATLGEALIAKGQKQRANAILAPFWRTTKLTEKSEKLILNKAGSALTQADHLYRMKAMLYASRVNSASNVANLAKARSLFEAASAVIRNDKTATKKIAAVDKSFRTDPLFMFIQIQNLRRQEKITEATKIMLKAPKTANALIDPDAWWIERRVLSRELLDIGQPQRAYQLVAAHSAESPSSAVDAEFHAGWYALRFMNDPQTAMKHFSRIPSISSRPVSLALGYYWMGRSAEALKDKANATKYFQNSAQYGTTYYGQLAASRLGTNTIKVPYPQPTSEQRQKFSAREPVIAIKRLEASGYKEQAKMLYLELANELTSPGELAMLSALAEKQNDHYTSLRIGKIAALRGLNVGALTHPVGAIPDSANISSAGKALAYAIARQESEFRVNAVSSAGARGMLQLMPATAQSTAKTIGLPYVPAKLTTDAGYNATLGAHVLGQQLDRFNGSYILTFIGYNAGPKRASQWIERYGDPRGKSIDEVVDWVERIPYTETRHYVMRVMENYQTYKMRLTGKTDIKSDLTSGRKG